MNITCDTVCMDRRQALGRALKRYRMGQGMRHEDLAPLLDLKARVTVGALERGDSVKEWTYYAIDRYFGWNAGTTVDYLAGELDELPEMLPPALANLPAEFAADPHERAIWALGDLSEDRRRAIISELRRARSRMRAKRAAETEDESPESCSG